MPAALDLTGKTFGRLTVRRFAGSAVRSDGRLARRWECRCACGRAVEVYAAYLRNGDTKSCGCASRDAVVGRNKKRALSVRLGGKAITVAKLAAMAGVTIQFVHRRLKDGKTPAQVLELAQSEKVRLRSRALRGSWHGKEDGPTALARKIGRNPVTVHGWLRAGFSPAEILVAAGKRPWRQLPSDRGARARRAVRRDRDKWEDRALRQVASLGAAGRLRPWPDDAALLEGFRQLFNANGVRLVVEPARDLPPEAWRKLAAGCRKTARPRRWRKSRAKATAAS